MASNNEYIAMIGEAAHIFAVQDDETALKEVIARDNELRAAWKEEELSAAQLIKGVSDGYENSPVPPTAHRHPDS